MTRCGCASGSCSCSVIAGTGATITGTGATNNPYVVTGPVFQLLDTATIGLSMTGIGSAVDPFVLSGIAAVTLDELDDVEAATPTAGSVLAWSTSPTPAWRPVPASSAPVGAISVTATSMSGDGSAGAPLAVKLQPGGGISNSATGLWLTSGPLVVTSTTRPASPTNGMLIYETDTRLLLVYDITYVDWVPPGTSANAIYAATGTVGVILKVGSANLATATIPAATYPRIVNLNGGCLMYQTAGSAFDLTFVLASTPTVSHPGRKVRVYQTVGGSNISEWFLCPPTTTPVSAILQVQRVVSTGTTTFVGMTDGGHTYIEAVARRG